MELPSAFAPGFGLTSGIRVGLKMLTVLFIGGASGSAQLLGCQRTDGAGRFIATVDFQFQCGSFQAFIRFIRQGQLKLLRCICSACSVSGTALKEFAFRPLFPHERCEEAIWVGGSA